MLPLRIENTYTIYENCKLPLFTYVSAIRMCNL